MLNYHPENTCSILPGPRKVKAISLILCDRNLKLPLMTSGKEPWEQLEEPWSWVGDGHSSVLGIRCMGGMLCTVSSALRTI